jgi:hypothetical protein
MTLAAVRSRASDLEAAQRRLAATGEPLELRTAAHLDAARRQLDDAARSLEAALELERRRQSRAPAARPSS